MGDLRTRTVRAGAITLSAQAFRFGIQLSTTFLLARLLSPSDYGRFAMVAVLTGLVGVLRDAGLSAATVQRAEITHAQVSTLFWVNVGVSLAAMGVVVAASPALVWFYHEPALAAIAMALAPTFLFAGLAVQHLALLRRQMRFKDLALCELGSQIAGVTVALAMAFHDYGYWALAGQALTASSVHLGLVWRATRWTPAWPQRIRHVRSLLAFGGHLTGANLLARVADDGLHALVGALFGPALLGLYTRASDLMLLPLRQIIPPIMAVAQPALSRLQRNTRRATSASVALLEIATLGAMFALPVLVVAADEIVAIVLGPKWMEIVPLFRVLAVFAAVQPIASVSASILTAAGKGSVLLGWNAIRLVIILGAAAIGTQWGIMGVASAYAVSGVVLRIPIFLYLVCRNSEVSGFMVLGAVIPNAVRGLIMVVVLSLIYATTNPPAQLYSLAAVVAAALVLYPVLLCATPGGRRQLQQLRSLLATLTQPTMGSRSPSLIIS